MFSTVAETPAGAKTLPTTPLAYTNLIGVKSWAVRAEVSFVAGMKASLGQMPLYSKISGSASYEDEWQFEWIVNIRFFSESHEKTSLLFSWCLPSARMCLLWLDWLKLCCGLSLQLVPDPPQAGRPKVMPHICTRRSFQKQTLGLQY